MFKAFFDESIDRDKTVLAIGGFFFEPLHARKLNQAWKRTLAHKDFGITDFHMTDCANSAPPFDKLGKGPCDRLARSLIKHIRHHAEFQVAVSVNIAEYVKCARMISEESGLDWLFSFGGPYTFIAQMAINNIAEYCDERAYRGLITYYFEQGTSFQKEAERFLGLIPFSPRLLTKYRYYTHMFVPKKGPAGMRLLQAADILAWEWMRDRTEQFEQPPVRPRRLSLSFLLKNRLGRREHLRESEIMPRFRDTLDANIKILATGWKPYVRSEFDRLADIALSLQSIPK
ncbi:MAG: hypothetical protein M3O35_22730 [Acidobacteriota bacterium]|nr:hypothetical protein [Acidobacteriota bacterium]